MQKTALLLACALLIIPCAATADTSLVELVKDIRPAVATIITYDKDKKSLGQGSGFFIDKNGSLITNYHVLKGAYSAEVKTFGGEQYPVKLVLAENENVDLIKVSVDIPKEAPKFVQVSKTVPEVAERIVVVGSPMGLEQTVSEGIIAAVRDIPTVGKVFQISAPISPGSSGSPVVNMKGQVIGVASFQLLEGQNLNFAVSGEHVFELKSEKKAKTLAEWALGASTKQTDLANDLVFQGLLFLRAGEFEKALGCFEKAIGENNRLAEAWIFGGYCYEKLSRHQEAIEAFKQAIRIKPDDADTYSNLGVIYVELGRYHEAIEAHKQAISIRHDYAEAHCNMGLAFSNLGRQQEAIEACKQAIRIKPDYVEAHCNLGIAYSKLGRHQEAMEASKQAIRIKPDYVEAYNNLGIIYGDLGRYQEAIETYKKAIRIKPDHATAHLNLAVAYYNLGRYQEAIESSKQTIRIKPDDAEAHYNLGVCYLKVGDKSSAFEEYKILKGLNKNLANKLLNYIYK